MNNLNKKFINDEGNIETMVATSDDSYGVKIDKKYKLARKNKEVNSITRKFKSSFLGSDIGIKSSGFTSIAALAAVIAIGVIVVLFFLWRV